MKWYTDIQYIYFFTDIWPDNHRSLTFYWSSSSPVSFPRSFDSHLMLRWSGVLKIVHVVIKTFCVYIRVPQLVFAEGRILPTILTQVRLTYIYILVAFVKIVTIWSQDKYSDFVPPVFGFIQTIVKMCSAQGCSWGFGALLKGLTSRGSHTERETQGRPAPRLGRLEVMHTRCAHSILFNYLKCVVKVVSWYIQ